MSTVKSTYSGFVGLDGVPVLLHDGDEYDAGHPLVEAYPHMFTEPRRSPGRPPAAKGKATDD
jgi:hypothetical protein